MTTTSTTTMDKAGTETALRAAARGRRLTMQELAEKIGTTPGYLSQVATGRKPWSPRMRERAEAVLGAVPGQGTVPRQYGAVSGKSGYIRERARKLGMSMRDLAARAGVSYPYLVRVSRGRRAIGGHARGASEGGSPGSREGRH